MATVIGSLFPKLIGVSRLAAWRVVGGLSRPSKMPCYAWGIPAASCQAGSKLALVARSICSRCYAFKGFYRTRRVQAAYQRRLEHAEAPEWVDAMIKLVYWQAAETGEPYFRWFDSGDLQSVEMLKRIALVARETPEISHWLPTREVGYVREFLRREAFPVNLLVRISARWVDAPPPHFLGLPTSTVHDAGEPIGFTCDARSQAPVSCGDCRACWDGLISNVSYGLH